MDITKNKYELIDRKVKRKKTERTTAIAREQRRANTHYTAMYFRENKKKEEKCGNKEYWQWHREGQRQGRVQGKY